MKKIFKPIIQYYLKVLTRIVLWRHKPLIIAVAGTTNKTFVKEMILDELGRSADVRGNPRSFNTEIGLPLAVLFLPSGYSSIFKWVDVLLAGTMVSIFSQSFPKILVLEMGVDRHGDMEYLLSLVQPKIAVITTIDKSFPDNHTTLDDVARELGLLVESIPEDGLVLMGAYDERVRDLASKSKSRVIVFGKDDDCEAQIKNVRSVEMGQQFELVWKGKTMKIETERYGTHNIDAIVAAKIVAEELKK